MKTAIGMSGGVDSSVAAALLKEKGDIAGITLRLYDEGECRDASMANIADARAVCDRLGIRHFVLELKAQFREYVIENFLSEYLNGRTPNPCVQCNKYIKFGAMLDFAKQNGFDKIATGHYARAEVHNGRYCLKKAVDPSKDQSYVLYNLTQEQLSSVEFPLGVYTKAQIREIAGDMRLASAHKSDSQDICFAPSGDYAKFIEDTCGISSPAGVYTDRNNNLLGQHKGLIHYTVGQRKGLGISMGYPVFVTGKDAANNRVIIGEEQELFFRKIEVADVNFISGETPQTDIRAAAKLRYRHFEQACVIHPTGKNTVVLEFDTPQRAPAPGQSAVFYDGDTVLGGGIIEKGI